MTILSLTDPEAEDSTTLNDLDVAERPIGLEVYATWALDVGWDPIPVWGVDETGACACRNGGQCKSPGKHPVVNAWQSQEKISVQDAYALFATPAHPTNIGLRTGARSGFWALDIDPKSGGDESLLALESEHGKLPTTWVHQTGSGGRHYLFKMPDDFDVTNSRGRLPCGIDVRGNGGFIVAPGSVTAVGAYRTEVPADVASAPEWLLDLIRPKPIERAVDVVESVTFDTLGREAQGRARRYLDGALASEIARLEAMKTEAQQDLSSYRGEPWNQTVYDVCCNLLELAQSQWLPFGIEDVKRILAEHAPTDSGFTGADVEGCLASATDKVRGKDRSMPASITQDSWELLTAGIAEFLPQSVGDVSAEQWPQESWNQVGNAKRTLRMAAGRLAWVAESSTWYECGTDGIWRAPSPTIRDDTPAKWVRRAMEAAAMLEAHNYDEEPQKRRRRSGDDAEEDSEAKKFAEFMRKSSTVEMHSAVAHQLRRSAEDFGILIEQSRFDSDPYAFACANGLIDLRTGAIRAIRPEDYISIASPVECDPTMPIPTFLRFLETSHPDAEVRDFLQVVLGYSMTGVNAEQKMFIHYGMTTANGKSVLMNAVSAAMGEYFRPAPEKAILKQRVGVSRVGQDLIDLVGPRFLTLNETNQGAALDGEIIKSITSGDERADRAHYRGNTRYRVSGKIHLVTNHLPHITADQAMDRRLVVIPWTQSFTDNPDPQLQEKLAAELPGILAWLVQGAVRWHRDLIASGKSGLNEPALCLAAKEVYFEEEDEVASWLKEVCEPLDSATSPTRWTASRDLYRCYTSWRMNQGLQSSPMSVNAFGRALSAKGYDATQTRVSGSSVKVRPIRIRATTWLANPFGN